MQAIIRFTLFKRYPSNQLTLIYMSKKLVKKTVAKEEEPKPLAVQPKAPIPKKVMPAKKMPQSPTASTPPPQVQSMPQAALNKPKPMLNVQQQAPIEKVKVMAEEPIVVPPKVEKVKQSAPYDLEANLKLTIKAQKKIIKLKSKEEQVMPILVNLKTQDLTEEQEDQRSPIDLICVIDHSGSMAGEKIDLVRKTLKSLLEFTNQYDRISLIQFDDRAEQLTPLIRNTPQNLQFFEAKIKSLKDRGGTDINAGMQMAFQVIRNRKTSNPVTSIFLLTDGLDGGAFERVQSSLITSKINDQTFTVSCFGFGKDHDEELMVKIAKLRDGSFYYIQKLDTVDESFADALGGLMSVVALETSIFVKNVAFKPFDGIKIRNTFGDKWVKQGVTSGYQIKLSQLLAGAQKGFMAELYIPPIDVKVSDKERSIVVIQADLVTNDKSGKMKIEKNAKLTLHLLNEDEPDEDIEEDGQVLENYFRVKGAISIEEAMNEANKGNYEEGKTKLQKMVKQITANKKVNQEKLVPLLVQLKQSEQTCEPKVYNYGGKKAMMSKGYAMMEQKPASEAMYQNKVQEKMVNKAKMKKEM